MEMITPIIKKYDVLMTDLISPKQKIVPCCNQGYKIHIVDLHKKTRQKLQQDREILEFCLWELASKFKRFMI
jgi:hypothetical protein